MDRKVRDYHGTGQNIIARIKCKDAKSKFPGFNNAWLQRHKLKVPKSDEGGQPEATSCAVVLVNATDGRKLGSRV